MSIIRGKKNRQNPFVQIDNRMFQDPELSLKAKGLIGYCLSKPDYWKFTISIMAQELKEGERCLYATINECIEKGYALRYQIRKNNGDFAPVELILSDSRDEINTLRQEIESTEDFEKMFTLSCFAHAQVADAQKSEPPHISSNTVSSNTQPPPNLLPPQKEKGGGGGSLSEKKEPFGQIHECLKDLTLDPEFKERLSQYPIANVELSVRHCFHPKFVPNVDLPSALIYFTKNPQYIPERIEDEIDKNKEYAMMREDMYNTNQHTKFATYNNYCELTSGNWNKVINYSEKGFKEQLDSELRKRELI